MLGWYFANIRQSIQSLEEKTYISMSMPHGLNFLIFNIFIIKVIHIHCGNYRNNDSYKIYQNITWYLINMYNIYM